MKNLFFIIILFMTTICSRADDSGTCGENLTWTYVSSTQTLTISGSGPMEDYQVMALGGDPMEYAYYTPWKKYMNAIERVIIEQGVTSIGNNAFFNMTSLSVFEIPNSVTSIGSNAFLNTAWYNNQPDGMVYVGNFALKYKGTMPNNTNIQLRNGTVRIANSAFSGCYGRLISITIPNSVTSIGSSAFYYCTGLTSITIPNSVTSIGDRAFSSCAKLTSVTIPNSVTSIGDGAFTYCTGLTSITIPNSVTRIGENAFDDCI